MEQAKIPKHVAIIPDGNRRWARAHGVSIVEGYREGFKTGLELTTAARELGIKVLTFWCFSTENWSRTKEEVGPLMKLFEIFIDENLKKALKDKVRIVHIGRKDRLSDSLRNKIIEAEQKTKDFTEHYLVAALDYGGRDEIVRVVNKLLAATEKITEVTKEMLSQVMDTNPLPYPDVDLVIRTGGEQRTSGFMPWQTEYAEYAFIPEFFPDLKTELFKKCIEDFSERQRRFGK